MALSGQDLLKSPGSGWFSLSFRRRGQKIPVGLSCFLPEDGQKGSNVKVVRQDLTPGLDHIAANLQIETEDFEYAPFAQEGGIGKGWQLFGEDLQRLLDELNGALVA